MWYKLILVTIVLAAMLAYHFLHNRLAHDPNQKVRWTKTMVARTQQTAAQLGIREDGVVVWRAMQFKEVDND